MWSLPLRSELPPKLGRAADAARPVFSRSLPAGQMKTFARCWTTTYSSRPRDLGKELVERYTQRAVTYPGDADERTPGKAIERVTQLFRDALIRDDKMCLCGSSSAPNVARCRRRSRRPQRSFSPRYRLSRASLRAEVGRRSTLCDPGAIGRGFDYRPHFG